MLSSLQGSFPRQRSIVKPLRKEFHVAQRDPLFWYGNIYSGESRNPARASVAEMSHLLSSRAVIQRGQAFVSLPFTKGIAKIGGPTQLRDPGSADSTLGRKPNLAARWQQMPCQEKPGPATHVNDAKGTDLANEKAPQPIRAGSGAVKRLGFGACGLTLAQSLAEKEPYLLLHQSHSGSVLPQRARQLVTA